MKHTLNLEIGGCQKIWFSKYVCPGQDHFWMEHGIKTRGKHQHTSMYMENKVYFELTTKHIKYLQQLEQWNFIKKMHTAMLNNRYTNIAYVHK